MSTTIIYAFVVIAISPLIGIWRGHAWARKNGLVLRVDGNAEQDQFAPSK